MSSKAWIISVQPIDKSAEPDVIEHISNRKKIAQVEDYLCATYNEMLEKELGDTEELPALKAALIRVSGVEVHLEKSPYIIRAVLGDTSK